MSKWSGRCWHQWYWHDAARWQDGGGSWSGWHGDSAWCQWQSRCWSRSDCQVRDWPHATAQNGFPFPQEADTAHPPDNEEELSNTKGNRSLDNDKYLLPEGDAEELCARIAREEGKLCEMISTFPHDSFTCNAAYTCTVEENQE